MKSEDYIKFSNETLLKKIKIRENFIGSPLMINKIEKKLHKTLENFNNFQLPTNSKYDLNLTPLSNFRKKINLNSILIFDLNKKSKEENSNISLLKKIIKYNKNNKINFKEFKKNKDLIEKFSRNYNKLLILDKKKGNEKLNALKDIENIYKSKNYKLPKNIFKKNIFNENPLLMTSKSEINNFFFSEKFKQEKNKNYIPNLNSEKFLTNTVEFIERKKINIKEKNLNLKVQNDLQKEAKDLISNNYKSISEDKKEIKNLFQYLNNLEKEKEKEKEKFKSKNLIKIEINEPTNINEINKINKEFNTINSNNDFQGQNSIVNSSSILSPNNTKSTNFFSFQKSRKQSIKKLTLVNFSPQQTFINSFRKEEKNLSFKKKRFSQILILNNNSFYSNDKNILISDNQNNNNNISKTYELIKKTYSSNNIFNHQKKVQKIVENYCKSQKLIRNKLNINKINIQNKFNLDDKKNNIFNIIKKDLILPEKTLKKIEINDSLEKELIQLNKKLVNEI